MHRPRIRPNLTAVFASTFDVRFGPYVAIDRSWPSGNAQRTTAADR